MLRLLFSTLGTTCNGQFTLLNERSRRWSKRMTNGDGKWRIKGRLGQARYFKNMGRRLMKAIALLPKGPERKKGSGREEWWLAVGSVMCCWQTLTNGPLSWWSFTQTAPVGCTVACICTLFHFHFHCSFSEHGLCVVSVMPTDSPRKTINWSKIDSIIRCIFILKYVFTFPLELATFRVIVEAIKRGHRARASTPLLLAGTDHCRWPTWPGQVSLAIACIHCYLLLLQLSYWTQFSFWPSFSLHYLLPWWWWPLQSLLKFAAPNAESSLVSRLLLQRSSSSGTVVR